MIGVAASVPHLQFADDTLLVGEKSWANVRALKAVLILFENISGPKVNFNKSMLFGVNINDSWLHEAAYVMRCKHGRFPFIYLGLPIGGDPRRLGFWQPVIDRIRNRLSGWSCKNLSFGGRLILLKFVLSFIPVYFLSFFKAPSGIISLLESLFYKFFWGGSEDKRKISWIKWDNICLNRENRGLRVMRLKDFNIALLGKWVWRCLEEGDSLWCQVLKAKYGERGGRVFFREGVGSPWWRAVNQVRVGAGLLDSRWLADSIVRKLGDGRNTLFWSDFWTGDGPLERSFSRLFDLADNKNVYVAEMFEAGWEVQGEGWKWRRRLRAWEEELLVECVNCLSNIVLQDGISDRWVWKMHTSQCYSVKSAYTLLTSSDVHLLEDANNIIWMKSVPLKVKVFLWRLFQNRLPTKDNLFKRGLMAQNQLACVMECDFPEDVNHLFFQCYNYGRLWQLISNWLGFVLVFHGFLHVHASQFIGLGGDAKHCRMIFTIIWISVLSTIWKDRNQRIFRATHNPVDTLAEKVKTQTYWWLKSSYPQFDFDYSFWRLHHMHCLQAIV